MTVRRAPIFDGDIRRIGGSVFVVPCRDHEDGGQHFRVRHISRGGDCVFLSPLIVDENCASASADTLAAFVGAQVRK
jgi:hypothetical protein